MRLRTGRTCRGWVRNRRPFVRWDGATVVILASGPSLETWQRDYVRQRQRAGACRVIGINTTAVEYGPVDAVYAYDRGWWQRYEEKTDPQAERITGDPWAAKIYGLTHVSVKPGSNLSHKAGVICSGLNSGHQAISVAYQKGAARIILLGYDMQHTGGQTHWHGDHPRGLTNAEGIAGWVKRFEPLARDLRDAGVDVINCTTETALKCFKRESLHDAL